MAKLAPWPFSGAGAEILDAARARRRLERRGLDIAAIEWVIDEAHTAAFHPVIVRPLEARAKALDEARKRILRASSDVLLFAAKKEYPGAPYAEARAFVDALRAWKPWRGRDASEGGRPREWWTKRLERELRKLGVRHDEVRDIARRLREHVRLAEARMVG